MIDAELRGKIPGNEDTLTSTALGLLAFLPDRAFIGFLSTAKPVDPDHQPLIAEGAVEGAVMEECELWPRLPGAGEPDARLRFAGADVTHVVIEAKRGAKAHAGQLVGYANGIEKFVHDHHPNPEVKIALVYLTHHPHCPIAELQKASHAYHAAHQGGHGPVKFFWLSWYQLHLFLIRYRREHGDTLEPTESRVCSALIRYLKGVDFSVFTGFSPYPGPHHVQPFFCSTRFQHLPGSPPRFLNRR